MREIKEWLLDRQENGDDGTGFNDYEREGDQNSIDSISWGELAELTHATQVERFGWCICEDPEQGQLAEDCPRAEEVSE